MRLWRLRTGARPHCCAAAGLTSCGWPPTGGDDEDKAPKPKRELTAYNLFIQVSARRALVARNAGALTRVAPPNAVQAGASQGGGVLPRSRARGSASRAVHARGLAPRPLARADLRYSVAFAPSARAPYLAALVARIGRPRLLTRATRPAAARDSTRS